MLHDQCLHHLRILVRLQSIPRPGCRRGSRISVERHSEIEDRAGDRGCDQRSQQRVTGGQGDGLACHGPRGSRKRAVEQEQDEYGEQQGAECAEVGEDDQWKARGARTPEPHADTESLREIAPGLCIPGTALDA